MEDIESKLGAILGNPDMMAQIMSIAQTLGGNANTPQAPPTPLQPQQEPFDIGMLSKLAGIASSASIDANQQALLRALQPYLSMERIRKLEKAMRAAKLAGIASGFLNSGVLSQLAGDTNV